MTSVPTKFIELEPQHDPTCKPAENIEASPEGNQTQPGAGVVREDSSPEELFGIPVDSRHLEFVERLRSTLIRESGIDSFREATIKDQESLVRTYKRVLESLIRLRDEWRTFLEGLIRIDLSLEPDDPDLIGQVSREESIKWRQEILEDPQLQPIPLSSGLVGHVIAQDLSVAFSDLVIDAESKIEQLHRSICSQLSRLIELEVCGILVRYPNQVYEYRYFFRTVKAINESDEVKRRLSWKETPGATPSIRMKHTLRVIDANVTRTVFGRIHHVIHGIEISPDRPTVPTPAYHQSVLDAIPSWLRPSTILVEGTLVGDVAPKTGRTTEHDRSAEEILRETEVHPEYHCDPALVLGQFVLTAWGPEELGARSSDSSRLTTSELRSLAGEGSLLESVARSIGTRMLSKLKSARRHGAVGRQEPNS